MGIDDEKEALRLNAQSSVQVLKDKIEESKSRTKEDIELLTIKEISSILK